MFKIFSKNQTLYEVKWKKLWYSRTGHRWQ